MASSLSDILSAVQNGVIALNNMAVQIKGSFNNILSRFVTDEANIATNAAAIAALEVLPYKIVLFTRDLSVASGNQSITGVGFQPRLILFQTGVIGGETWSSSGQADATTNASIEYNSGGGGLVFYQGTFAGIQRDDAPGNDYQSFIVATYDSDGFTLTWTKVNAPTALASITATCYR